jgi:hypothetical protein
VDSTENTRVHPPSEFVGTFRHACLAKCGQIMIVPDRSTPGAPERLEDGQIWRCGTCGALHEYYLAFGKGERAAIVRLLKGLHVRSSAEPRVDEFMEKKK